MFCSAVQVWEDGPILRDLAARKAALHRAKEGVDAARKVGYCNKCLLSLAAAAIGACQGAYLYEYSIMLLSQQPSPCVWMFKCCRH